VPTYRLYLNGVQTQWIDFTTAIDASEAPDIDSSNATMFQDGSFTTDDLTSYQMMQRLAVLPDITRPLVTDYGKWGIATISFTPTIDYTVSVSGGGSSAGTYTCTRPVSAIGNLVTSLNVLGIDNTLSTDGTSVLFKALDPDITITGGEMTVSTIPLAWSGPVLIP
jgi:hypothetical protein